MVEDIGMAEAMENMVCPYAEVIEAWRATWNRRDMQRGNENQGLSARVADQTGTTHELVTIRSMRGKNRRC